MRKLYSYKNYGTYIIKYEEYKNVKKFKKRWFLGHLRVVPAGKHYQQTMVVGKEPKK